MCLESQIVLISLCVQTDIDVVVNILYNLFVTVVVGGSQLVLNIVYI